MPWNRAAWPTVLCLGTTLPTLAQEPLPKPGSPPRASTHAQPVVRPPFRYRGISIDVSVLASDHALQPLLPSLRRQIDIAVDARVKPEIAEFFKTVPIALGLVPGGGPGYCDGKSIVMVAQPLAFDRVVLLHELIHAYHARRTTNEERQQIRKFFREASGPYHLSPTEYFLTNPQEFLAVTGSIYLHGSIPRAPSTREAIREAQPDYYRFLSRLFDPPTDPTPPESATNPGPISPPPSQSPDHQPASPP